jgi:Arc/MetJ family transcription regulator
MTLGTQKVVVQTTEKQGTMQDGTKTSYKQAERRFCFEGKRDGDYRLAFILYKKRIPSTGGHISDELLTETSQILRFFLHGGTDVSEVACSSCRKIAITPITRELWVRNPMIWRIENALPTRSH